MLYRKLFQGLIYLLLIVFLIWIFNKFKSEFITVSQTISWAAFVVVCLLQATTLAFGGIPFKTLCIPLNIYIRWQDWLALSYVASLLNQILPYRPGLLFRFAYLKRHYKITGTDFFAVMFLYFMLLAGGALLLAFISYFSSNLPKVFTDKLFPALGVFSGLVFGLMLIKIISRNKTKAPWGTHAINTMLHRPLLILISGVWVLLALLVGSLSFYLIFIDLLLPLPFTHCMFLVSLLSISMLVPVTPGNLGIAEAIIGAMTQILYGEFTQGFMAVALFRMSQFSVSFLIGGPILSYFVICKKIG